MLAAHSATWYRNTHRLQVVLLSLLALGASLALVRPVLKAPFETLGILLGLLVLAATVWRPVVGLYSALALVMLFEPGGADPLMTPGRYLNWGLQSTLGLSGFILSPLELLCFLAFGVWLITTLADRRPLRLGVLGRPMLLFYLAVLGGLARGILDGGDAYIAFWEARALLLIPICFLVAANTIRTPAHLSALITVTLLAGGLFAVEGAYRQIALIGPGVLGVVPEFAYAHDTVIFLGLVILLALVLPVVGAPWWQRLLAFGFAPIALFTLLATQRRAGQIALMVAGLAYALVFLVRYRKAFFLLAVPLLIGAAVYFPLFWNNTGMLGQPARAVRSLSEPDPRDASSNDYRAIEKFNVRATILSNPLLGVGFGKEFYFVQALPSLSWWPFWHYEPHHNVLWVWLKTGTIGFVLFWLLMGRALGFAAHCVKRAAHRDDRSFSLVALAGLAMTLVFCYVDLGLTDTRVTLFLGVLLGSLSAVSLSGNRESLAQIPNR